MVLNKENVKQVASQAGKYIGSHLGGLGKYAGGLLADRAPKIPGLDYQLLGEYGGQQLGGLFRRGGAVRRRAKKGKGRK